MTKKLKSTVKAWPKALPNLGLPRITATGKRIGTKKEIKRGKAIAKAMKAIDRRAKR